MSWNGGGSVIGSLSTVSQMLSFTNGALSLISFRGKSRRFEELGYMRRLDSFLAGELEEAIEVFWSWFKKMA